MHFFCVGEGGSGVVGGGGDKTGGGELGEGGEGVG